MRAERAAYEAIYQVTSPSPLPVMSAFEEIPLANGYGSACGWMILSKKAGASVSFDDLEQMQQSRRDDWIYSMVSELLKVENALAKVKVPCILWNNGYAESRLRFIHNDIPCATEDSRAIASNLA
ncbi:MAG: hypothetical protein PHW76_04250, partial [Alphaproteobacteria bacterium]|nr:hypothetical protein [Alphaproteobacteria bacterium]